jgi:site-specific DNA-methyltransferase (adenine-specific)
MAETADNSVHLVITSPPYWQLKDYGTDNQIGFTTATRVISTTLTWCGRSVTGCCTMAAVFV